MPFLPKPIYELLPFVYGLVGIFAVLSEGNGLMRLSGVILTLAAAHIFLLRRSARRSIELKPRRKRYGNQRPR